jgi:hypothetical protein
VLVEPPQHFLGMGVHCTIVDAYGFDKESEQEDNRKKKVQMNEEEKEVNEGP